MTAVIADTDILSTFGKIGRLDLLQLLFDQVYIAPAVWRELGRAAQLGFIWVASVQRDVLLLPLTADESGEVERLTSLYPQLGSGELESFVLAQMHHLACLTNDRQAKVVAQALGLSYLDLEEILRAFKTRKLLTTAALTALIAQIEGTTELPLTETGGTYAPELDELYDALVSGTPVLHSGRWGLATLEVCLAIMQSATAHRDIPMQYQVAVPDGV